VAAKALSAIFVQVLRLCQKAGLVKLGHVALDGTKRKANASKHKAMSCGRMCKVEKELRKEVEEWLSKAEATDEEEDADPVTPWGMAESLSASKAGGRAGLRAGQGGEGFPTVSAPRSGAGPRGVVAPHDDAQPAEAARGAHPVGAEAPLLPRVVPLFDLESDPGAGSNARGRLNGETRKPSGPTASTAAIPITPTVS
jgi:hypothetical protein